MSAAPIDPDEPGADDVDAQSALLVDALLGLARPAADEPPPTAAPTSEESEPSEPSGPCEPVKTSDTASAATARQAGEEGPAEPEDAPGPRPGALATALVSFADATSLFAVGLRAMADALTEREAAQGHAGTGRTHPRPDGPAPADETPPAPETPETRVAPETRVTTETPEAHEPPTAAGEGGHITDARRARRRGSAREQKGTRP